MSLLTEDVIKLLLSTLMGGITGFQRTGAIFVK